MNTQEPEELQLPYLVTFSKAAELSNFSGAAKALRLSQAAVSQRVQALEKTLGKPLFRRNGRSRVLLTAAGRKLYDYAQRILDLHREARREVAGQEPRRPANCSSRPVPSPASTCSRPCSPIFGQKHPHVRVRATVTDSMAVISQVERGEVSLGLVGRKDRNPHLEFRYLASDRMVLVVPPGHALGRRKKVSVKQLSGHPLILRESGSGLRHCFEKSLERAGRSLGDLPVALELGSNEGIKEAVLRGVGVAVLSAYAVQKELRAGTLLALELSDLGCDREMFVVRDKRRVLPLPARLFLDFLDQHPLPSGPLSPELIGGRPGITLAPSRFPARIATFSSGLIARHRSAASGEVCHASYEQQSSSWLRSH